MILIPNVGFILTDVEYKEPARKYAEFQINVDETYKYCRMQEKYRLDIWYWMLVLKVKEMGENKKFGEYFGIPLENFIVVSKNQGMDKLFLEMMEIEKR